MLSTSSLQLLLSRSISLAQPVEHSVRLLSARRARGGDLQPPSWRLLALLEAQPLCLQQRSQEHCPPDAPVRVRDQMGIRFSASITSVWALARGVGDRTVSLMVFLGMFPSLWHGRPAGVSWQHSPCSPLCARLLMRCHLAPPKVRGFAYYTYLFQKKSDL